MKWYIILKQFFCGSLIISFPIVLKLHKFLTIRTTTSKTCLAASFLQRAVRIARNG